MKLVIDANVVFSALIPRSIAFFVFSLNSLSKKFEFIASEYLWLEIEKKERQNTEMFGTSKRRIGRVDRLFKGRDRDNSKFRIFGIASRG